MFEFFKSVARKFGPIKDGIQTTIGSKADLIGSLAKKIPYIGNYISPYVKTVARGIGQRKALFDIAKDVGQQVANNLQMDIEKPRMDIEQNRKLMSLQQELNKLV